MIKLIKNEFIKLGIIKIILVFVFLSISIYVIHDYYKDNFLDTAYKLISFVACLTCVLFSGIISSEYQNGTLKYYLTKPVKRWKVYLSKLLTLYIFMIIVSLFLIIIYSIFMGEIDTLFIIKYCKYSVPLFLIGTIVMFLSTIFNNPSWVTGVSIVILIFSLALSQVFSGFGLYITKYTFLPYTDFYIFEDKSYMIINNQFGVDLTYKKGVIINIIYSIIFFIFGLKRFIKKDISN